MKLTDKIVDTLPVPAKGNKRTPDSEVPGFNAQVTAAGERGFVLRYRVKGRERLYTIGSRPDVVYRRRPQPCEGSAPLD